MGPGKKRGRAAKGRGLGRKERGDQGEAVGRAAGAYIGAGFIQRPQRLAQVEHVLCLGVPVDTRWPRAQVGDKLGAVKPRFAGG